MLYILMLFEPHQKQPQIPLCKFDHRWLRWHFTSSNFDIKSSLLLTFGLFERYIFSQPSCWWENTLDYITASNVYFSEFVQAMSRCLWGTLPSWFEFVFVFLFGTVLVDKVFVRYLPSWCHLKGMEAQRAQKDSKMVYIQQNLFSDII